MKLQHQALHFYAACCISSAILFTACSEPKKERDEPADTISVQKTALNLTCTGYIISASEQEGKNSVVIDTVQYFSGDAAETALREDNKSSSGPENGFYIRNQRADSLKASVPEDCIITMQTFSHDSTGSFRFNEKISAGSFLAIFRNKKSERFRNVPFIFVISDGAVISIKEIYIP